MDKEFIDNPVEAYEKLKQECEELEKELRQKKMTILMNNDHYFEVDQTNKKLKQTLAEIKEIADTLRYYTNYGSEDDVNADLDKILQKCEVEDEEISNKTN